MSECPVCLEVRVLSNLCSNHHGVCNTCYQRLSSKICPTCRGRFNPPQHANAGAEKQQLVKAIKNSIADNTEESALQANYEGLGMQNANWTFDTISGIISEWHRHQLRMIELEESLKQWFSDDRMQPVTDPFTLTSTYTGNPHNNANVTREVKKLTSAGAKLLKTVGSAKQQCGNRRRDRLGVMLHQMRVDMDNVRTVGINVKDAIDNPPKRRRRPREDAAQRVD